MSEIKKKIGKVIMQLQQTCNYFACVMSFYGSLIGMVDSRLLGLSVDTKIA